MTAPVYRFLPWARRGLAQGVLDDETITEPSSEHALPARSTLPVSMDVNGVPAATTVQLYGPGDVTGIDRRVVLRSDPSPGATDFEPNYLVTIDFDPPDLPWMFTPARAVGDQLRPWCVLIVVERTAGVAISIRPGAVLPVLSIVDRPRPGASCPTSPNHGPGHTPRSSRRPGPTRATTSMSTSTWTPIGTSAGSCARASCSPTRATSRPSCRRSTTACSAASAQQPTGDEVRPAWDVETVEVDRPADVPLVRVRDRCPRRHRVDGQAPPRTGARPAGARAAPRPRGSRSSRGRCAPHLPTDAATVTMFGALRPASMDTATPMPVQDPALTERLTGVVGARDTAQLPPPLYGEWPAATPRAGGAATGGWFAELNSTVAHRIAAGLGAEVVRRHQEAFVQSAWQQVGRVREANDLAGRARLAAAVLERVVTRHVLPLPPDRIVQTAGPMLAGAAQPDSWTRARPRSRCRGSSPRAACRRAPRRRRSAASPAAAPSGEAGDAVGRGAAR